ncbi:hypothetical protein KSF73_08040 [Burkholderiaceae bacterium DAT-1]|nr:hypothetical protein [Burkholderiaceae bacterium DAT-1]
MQTIKYNVYGRILVITATEAGWQVAFEGADGTRRPADIIIPDFIEADELGQYLEDLYHEHATPRNGDVVRID